ncbi:MAG: hypothetical protein ACE5KI_01480, partial [Dehalococcoidia bacterium]
ERPCPPDQPGPHRHRDQVATAPTGCGQRPRFAAKWVIESTARSRNDATYPPTSTMIGTSVLVHPDMVVEIDADAVL